MAVTPDEVGLLYRALLGREPESSQVLEEAAAHVPDLPSLGRLFVESAEFRARFLPLFLEPKCPMAVGVDQVETEASADDLARLAGRVREAWSRLGEEKPHFSVLTADEFLPDSFKENEPAFWASGEIEVEAIGRSLARHGVGELGRLECNEYGCGVGRLTGPLAARFAKVNAYDISAGHLALARSRLDRLGRSNVMFHDVSADTLAPLAPCDVYLSFIVLQHNPPPIILALVRRALESLRPGGLALFQIPVWISDYAFSTRAYLDAPAPEIIEMHYVPQERIFALSLELGCRMLEVRKDSWGGDTESYTYAIRRP